MKANWDTDSTASDRREAVAPSSRAGRRDRKRRAETKMVVTGRSTLLLGALAFGQQERRKQKRRKGGAK